MSSLADKNRRTRILDAAEQAFAELGFGGASLRHIVLEARVNLATVYYYFGSKEGLMEAVFNRRFGPLCQEHLDLLEKCRQNAKDRPVAVEKIMEAMLLPALRLAANLSANSPVVMRLIGRMATEPNVKIQKLLRAQYAGVKSATLAALQRSLPTIPLPDLRWRIEFVLGALAFILCNPGNIKEATEGVCDPLDTEKILSQMVGFFSAGFRA